MDFIKLSSSVAAKNFDWRVHITVGWSVENAIGLILTFCWHYSGLKGIYYWKADCNNKQYNVASGPAQDQQEDANLNPTLDSKMILLFPVQDCFRLFFKTLNPPPLIFTYHFHLCYTYTILPLETPQSYKNVKMEMILL